jgi:tetratricopeptide (TPR) repeat protein
VLRQYAVEFHAAAKDAVIAAFVQGDYEAVVRKNPPEPTLLHWLCYIHALFRLGRASEADSAIARGQLYIEGMDVIFLASPYGYKPLEPSKVPELDPRAALAHMMLATSLWDEATRTALQKADESDFDDEMLRVLRAESTRPLRGGRRNHAEGLLAFAKQALAERDHRVASAAALAASDLCGDWKGPLRDLKGRCEATAAQGLRLRTVPDQAVTRLEAALANLRPHLNVGDAGMLQLRDELLRSLQAAGRLVEAQESAYLLLAHAATLPKETVSRARGVLLLQGILPPGETEAPADMPAGRRYRHIMEHMGAQAVLEATAVTADAERLDALLYRAAAYHEVGRDEEAEDCLRGVFDAFEAAEREQRYGATADMQLEEEILRLGLKAIADRCRFGAPDGADAAVADAVPDEF